MHPLLQTHVVFTSESHIILSETKLRPNSFPLCQRKFIYSMFHSPLALQPSFLFSSSSTLNFLRPAKSLASNTKPVFISFMRYFNPCLKFSLNEDCFNRVVRSLGTAMIWQAIMIAVKARRWKENGGLNGIRRLVLNIRYQVSRRKQLLKRIGIISWKLIWGLKLWN